MDITKIHEKWQKKWEDAKIFKVSENKDKKKHYVLEMYPYPSGSGLHMGHARNYVIGDSYARFKRMNNYNVLYPMGYDSFGLPAENAAVKAKSHPKKFTENAISNFMKQQKMLGLSYDWDRTVACHKPDYYKWDQWIFLQMLKKGLAYKKKATVNWCPKCKTVLANEQVHNGKCWRHSDTNVELIEKDQWFFKITEYAEELLNDIDKLDWAEDVKIMQKNWIGKSRGTIIDFKIKDSDKTLHVFTTRPDTFFGITYLVYAPEHPEVMELVKGTEYEEKVKEFVRKVVLEDKFKRAAEDYEKEGMFIGRYAINPITNEEIPIYIANFVLMDYGTGAIIAVPAHDQRDFEFAKKYDIPIKVVINPPDYELNPEKMSRAYMGDGNLVNSGEFDGMNNREAIEEITKFLEKKGVGRFTTQYKLRDWLISRQRFWGTPIPIVYCEKCGAVPVKEEDLPVELPEDVVFESAENPLLKKEDWINTTCPKCGGPAKRETDTMDTFVNSSWYFLRYTDPKNDKNIFDKDKANYWMPIDTYIGGKEHACMHLIYFRFYTKFLRDLGLLDVDEPANVLFNQGMLHKDGVVMSKSRGNVVLPEEVAEKYGIDTARVFLMFVAGPDKDMEWSDKGVEGTFRFLNRFVSLLEKDREKGPLEQKTTMDRIIISKINLLVKEVTDLIEDFKYNIAIGKIMGFVSDLIKYTEKDYSKSIFYDALEKTILLISPFAPHIAEEMWEQLGNEGFVSLARWPSYDESLIDRSALQIDEFIEEVRADIERVKKLAKIDKPKEIKVIISSQWKRDFVSDVKRSIEERKQMSDIIKEMMAKYNRKEIPMLVQRFFKDMSKLPNFVVSEEDEIDAIKENMQVTIEKEDESQEDKAKNAMPTKPAIILK